MMEGRGRAGRWFVGALAVAGASAVVWMGSRAWDMARREDTPERYAELATLLSQPTLSEGEVADRLSLAEQAVALRAYESRLRESAGACRELSQFATAQLDAIEAAHHLQQSQPAFEELAAGIAYTALGLYTQSDELTKEGGTAAIDGLADAVAFVKRLKEIQVAAHSNVLQFAIDAPPRFSGAAAPRPFIAAAFRPKAGVFSFRDTKADTVTLTNGSGGDLHDCVVVVRLKGASGETFSNVHFVPVWRAGAKRIAEYESGWFGRTVDDPVSVTVTAWSREASSPAATITPGLFGW
jgi:hypothetical protein